MIGLAGNGHPADLAKASQKIQVAVHRAQAQVGGLFVQRFEHGFGGGMVFTGQNGLQHQFALLAAADLYCHNIPRFLGGLFAGENGKKPQGFYIT